VRQTELIRDRPGDVFLGHGSGPSDRKTVWIVARSLGLARTSVNRMPLWQTVHRPSSTERYRPPIRQT
jgi:hypothetical protein